MLRRRVGWTAGAAILGVALGIPVGLGLAHRAAPPSDGAPLSMGTAGYDVVRDDPAPALAGPTLDGGRFDLADWRGHVVVLGVWASWCEPCRAELSLLADASSRGVRVVTLNVRDDAGAGRSMRAEAGATGLAAVRDPDGAVARAWGVAALPQTFVIDPAGRIRLQRFGPVTAAWLDRAAGLDRAAAGLDGAVGQSPRRSLRAATAAETTAATRPAAAAFRAAVRSRPR